mmetsp:Transcript_48927/g.151662  ORF Transcript_48927/g.151662 Transcript_48927/m.151662 type:complete len:377 (+) Transcript_48927:206-1336(+)
MPEAGPAAPPASAVESTRATSPSCHHDGPQTEGKPAGLACRRRLPGRCRLSRHRQLRPGGWRLARALCPWQVHGWESSTGAPAQLPPMAVPTAASAPRHCPRLAPQTPPQQLAACSNSSPEAVRQMMRPARATAARSGTAPWSAPSARSSAPRRPLAGRPPPRGPGQRLAQPPALTGTAAGSRCQHPTWRKLPRAARIGTGSRTTWRCQWTAGGTTSSLPVRSASASSGPRMPGCSCCSQPSVQASSIVPSHLGASQAAPPRARPWPRRARSHRAARPRAGSSATPPLGRSWPPRSAVPRAACCLRRRQRRQAAPAGLPQRRPPCLVTSIPPGPRRRLPESSDCAATAPVGTPLPSRIWAVAIAVAAPKRWATRRG